MALFWSGLWAGFTRFFLERSSREEGKREEGRSQRNFKNSQDVPCDGRSNRTRPPNQLPVPATAHYEGNVDGGVSLPAKIKALEGSSHISRQTFLVKKFRKFRFELQRVAARRFDAATLRPIVKDHRT